MISSNSSSDTAKRVLVTGGTGFLGAYIISRLVDEGYHVRAMSRHNKMPFFISSDVIAKVDWIQGDVLDVVALEDAMKGTHAVVHAAGKVSFQTTDRSEMLHTNIEGTANVVNAAIAQKIKRFIHVSSVAAIGRTIDGEHVNENKQWQQSALNTAYGISKYQAEIEVWRGIAEGLPAVIVNPSTLIGYGDWNTSSCAIFKAVYNEFAWYPGGINGFADVEDVARIVVLLMQSDITAERFILNNENWPFRKLFDVIADGFGKRHPSKEATPLLAAMAWRMAKVKALFNREKPLLTKESANVAQTKTFFDNNKITRFLPGFNFTPLDQTINKACFNYNVKLAEPDLAK